MSRIYEALQKAESERGRDPRVDSGQEPAVAIAEYETPVAVEDTALPQARPAVAHSEYPARADAPRLAGIDLASVRTAPWAPSIRQLPSLLERGPAVEQFRSLRSRIYELRDLKPLKSILVTSAMPQDGKTFVAANLAISLARNKNARVLLIDGDMRRYTLHQLLGCESKPGLADYLAGRVELMDTLQRPEPASITAVSGVRSAGLPTLTFIAGGDGGDKAADLSNNSRFRELIDAASSVFDWIIVDSSPVLPVSDGVNLARSCDGVLLVARGGVTQFTDAQRAQGELKATNILGFVLNAIEKPPQAGGYYGYDPRQDGD